ncbi:hypothetical protein HD806DRAFT_530801 [Xylariaceae sp. AK1471]|nr:hypothetical protein HD806DRAFT_530801 [Xylariaceae sp. AK1471]
MVPTAPRLSSASGTLQAIRQVETSHVASGYVLDVKKRYYVFRALVLYVEEPREIAGGLVFGVKGQQDVAKGLTSSNELREVLTLTHKAFHHLANHWFSASAARPLWEGLPASARTVARKLAYFDAALVAILRATAISEAASSYTTGIIYAISP